MKLVTNIPNRRCHNCYSGNACYLIERKGGIFSEHFVFGLSGGLGFELTLTDTGFRYQAVRELHCITNYLLDHGVTIEEKVFENKQLFIQNIKHLIEEDTPAMIEYDGFYFEHTQVYQKEHEKRIGLIVGYEQDTFLLTDFVYGIYQLKVDRARLDSAVGNSKGIRACIYEPHFCDNLVVPRIKIYRTIKDVYDYFLNSKLQEGVYIGLDGMKKFSEDLLRINRGNNHFWIEFSEDLKQSVFTLRNYGLFLEQVSLNNYYDNSFEDELFECSQVFLTASNDWDLLCKYLYKNSICERQENTQKAVMKLEKVIKELRETFIKLKIINEGKLKK